MKGENRLVIVMMKLNLKKFSVPSLQTHRTLFRDLKVNIIVIGHHNFLNVFEVSVAYSFAVSTSLNRTFFPLQKGKLIFTPIVIWVYGGFVTNLRGTP